MWKTICSLGFLLIMICHSSATIYELENRMNVKFQNIDALLREQNERIRNLENTVNIQKVKINELTGQLDNVKIKNREKQTEIVKMKETISNLLQNCGVKKNNNNVDISGGKDDELAINVMKNIKKRLPPSNNSPSPTSSSTVAFYAQMSRTDSTLGQHQTLVFDTVKTNINGGNGGYSAFSGIFTVPVDGIYVFTISIRIKSLSFGSYVITKNGDSEGTFVGILEGRDVHGMVAGTIVIAANQGDIVFVKTHPTLSHKGEVVNDDNGQSTFAGWLI